MGGVTLVTLVKLPCRRIRAGRMYCTAVTGVTPSITAVLCVSHVSHVSHVERRGKCSGFSVAACRTGHATAGDVRGSGSGLRPSGGRPGCSWLGALGARAVPRRASGRRSWHPERGLSHVSRRATSTWDGLPSGSYYSTQSCASGSGQRLSHVSRLSPEASSRRGFAAVSGTGPPDVGVWVTERGMGSQTPPRAAGALSPGV